MTILVSQCVLPLFASAGWSKERRARVPEDISPSHPAYEVLSQFSGITVRPANTRGETCPPLVIGFQFLANDREHQEWETILGCRLVCIAALDDGDAILSIGSCGRCFGASQIHDAFHFFGEEFSIAAENILLGRRARPLLHPKQRSVSLYGDQFERGDPLLYSHASHA